MKRLPLVCRGNEALQAGIFLLIHVVELPARLILPDNPDDPDIPGVTEPIQPGEIIINELLLDPYVGGSEYIELYNRSEHSLSLSALSVAIRKSDGTLSTRYPLTSA